MAAILQLRQGSTSTYISQGPNIAEPFFDTGSNILVVGKSATEVIKLTKLDESNVGSFSITGDYTGSNLYLSGDISASNANLSGDITIGGNIILGDQVQDNITVSGQFDSDLIPSASATYNLGSLTKKWNHLYVESASIDSVNLVANLPSGVISGSSQISAFGFDGYGGWNLHDNSTMAYVSSGDTVYLVGRNGILGNLDTPDIYTRYLYFDLDTGSAHFTDAVAAVGAPAGTVSGSQQVIDFLPSGTISGSEQLPSGIVSSSSQITDASGIVSSSQQVIDFIPSGVVSGSSQILDGSGILSSSQSNFNDFSSSIHGDIEINYNFIQNLNAISHSHSNKTNLDSINQNLNTSDSVIFNTAQVGEASILSNLNVGGTASFDSDLTIYGDLTVFGTESIVNSENLSIADNMIYLNSGSTITNPDLGWAGNYNDGGYAHAGIFRDASDGIFKFYDGYTPEPEGSIDTSHASFNLSNVKLGILYSYQVNSDDFIGTGSQLVFPGTNIVSSSQQVIDFLPSGIVSGSEQLPSGIVSSSEQVSLLAQPFFYNYWGVRADGGSNIDVRTGYIVDIQGGDGIITSQFRDSTLIEIDVTLDTGSNHFISGAQEASLLGLPQGTVSGSDQVTQSLDTRYLEIDGDNVLSSSNENFLDYSQSVDLRLLDTLSSGSETSQSLHTLVGSFPTSGSLGTSAFYNVSSSLADDPNVIPNVKAVYDYINNTIGAADITGVSASLGLFGGGDSGYVSLSLDTASAHFQAGVELYSSVLPSGVISSSAQITDLGFLVTSSALYNDQYNLAVGTSTPTNLGATQFTINDSNTAGTSGLISFTDSDVVKSYDYVTNNYRYVDTNTGVGIVLKPDSDSTKSWVIDTDGDLVSNGGSWSSGNIYANNLIASSSITASNMLVDNDIIANNFIGNIQATNGVVSGSQQVIDSLPSGVVSGSKQITDFGFISESNSLYNDQYNLAIGTNTPTNLGATQFTINDSNTAGTSGLISFTDSDVLKSYDYVLSNYRYVDTNSGVGIVLKPDSDSNKSWVIDTDGDLVSNGGNWASGNAYMNNLIASSSITASNMLVDNDITANNFIGNIQSTNGVISGSSQLTSTFDTRYVTLSGTQTIGGTKTFNDIVVNGTGSFAYIESVAGSAKIIGDAFIILNNDTPTERYAGISVYDSGSTGVTASLQFDGQTNDWFYEYSDDGGVTTDHGVVMFGPEFSTKGAPTYNTNNTILKSNGGHHTLDSNITDDGSTITLGSNTTVSGVLSSTSVSSSLGFTSTAQRGLLVDNGDGYIQIGSGTVKTYLGQNDGSGYGYIETGDSGFNSDEFRILVGGTEMMYLSRADASDTGTDAVQIKNTDFSVDYDTLFVNTAIGSKRVGINKINPAVALDVVGDIQASADIIAYASSDRRLKEEITPISNPIEKINSIGGYSFIWNTEKQHIYKGKDYGVIAQEIEEILPELVDNRESGYKAVKYDRLVSLLIEGIKELSQEVKELKEKINRE